MYDLTYNEILQFNSDFISPNLELTFFPTGKMKLDIISVSHVLKNIKI